MNIAQIPPVLRWLRYFSTLGYTLEALAINEVGSGLQIVVRLFSSSACRGRAFGVSDSDADKVGQPSGGQCGD